MENKQVWFVTGASKGLGLSLVKQLLNGGYAVAATSRSLDALNKAVGNSNSNFLPLSVNLKSEESVQKAIEQTIATFGKIDVVVNNAGYGLFGAIEELTDSETRENFEVNVFGSLNVIRKVLPHLRKQGSGHIFNISSIGGFVGSFPGFGIYCATKFAVNGFGESLAEDVRPLGIKVTTVQPGYFRTNFLNSDSLATPANPIADYKAARESQELHQKQISNNQPGDPEKGVAVIIEVAKSSNPPMNLFLGSDAVGIARQKIEALTAEIAQWEALSVSTSF